MMKKLYLKRVFLPAALLVCAAVIVAVARQAPKMKPVKNEPLPVVGSFVNLQKLLKTLEDRQAAAYGFGRGEKMLGGVRAMRAAAPAAEKAGGSADSGYSTTNVQVEGVDEADIVKTDGRYVYKINPGKIIIARASPPSAMAVVATIETTAFIPKELYVDDKELVVVGESADGRAGKTETLIFDISDKSAPKEVRRLELEGTYVSSRKIGRAFYLVANKHPDIYAIMQNQNAAAGSAAPAYRDTATGRVAKRLSYEKIGYFPEIAEPSFLLVGGVNLDSGREMKVLSYLGGGRNVYASREHLYVAAGLEKTAVYRFALEEGDISYAGRGEVPGTILNQFSMDEYAQHFRIATTSLSSADKSGGQAQTNNVYVLGPDLSVTGKIENIAPGERIYSARFIGERAYMVTFKQVDPLFVIDLKDSAGPKILGELKVPGYSDYLHPLDENHIIGFGKDAREPAPVYPGDQEGVAYYQGLKIAVFDVSDVARPKEKFKTIIGDRGTESELLTNHKALLFDKERGVLAFPVLVAEVNKRSLASGETGPSAYGEPIFQGLYVYQIESDQSLTLRGKISHLKTPAGADGVWRYPNRHLERALFIGDILYTLSNRFLKAHGSADLTELGGVPLPSAEQPRPMPSIE